MGHFTLRNILEANALYWGDVDAYVTAERSITHRGLLANARRLASAWFRRGIRPQDRISILSKNNLEICELYAAGEYSGIITSTVNFRLAPPEIAYVVNDSASRILVFEAAYTQAIDEIRPLLPTVERYVCIGDAPEWAERWDDVMASGDPEAEISRPLTTDPAYIIYTSGTTGKPKGCLLGHESCVREAEVVNGPLLAGPDDRTLLMMPMFHIGAKGIQLAQHFRGGTIHLHAAFDPAAILADLVKHRINVTHMAPGMIQTLLEQPGIEDLDLSALRTILYSAAPMPEPVLRRALNILGPVFIQMYGQTEGTGTVLHPAAHRLDGNPKHKRQLTSVGVPFAGVELRLIDETGQDVARGEPGEILLRGPVMMTGYWNNSIATAETLRDGWLHTGDIGRQDEDGFLYLVDRKKDMIVSGGENIASKEVEEALYSHPAVAEVAVIGVPDEKWGETVHAIIRRRTDQNVTENELVDHCTRLIASYKRPRRVTFVEELPKLASGKIDKKLLRSLHG